MDNEMMRAYTARITQANRSELVVIIYELFNYSIDKAEEAFNIKNEEEALKYMRKAQGCIVELRGSLDHKYEIANNLERLYRYVHELIVKTIVKRKPVEFTSIREVMGGLLQAFEKIAELDNSETVMKNTQKVYAGLTYGRSSLNEVFMNENEASRGFRA